MTGPTYSQILEIMNRTMGEVTMAGHDVSLCVWELSPSIWRTLMDHPQTWLMKADVRVTRATFNGIPIREGVTDEATGILLKMVNPEPWQ